MKKYIVLAALFVSATMALAQQEKPAAKPQATERTAPQRAVGNEKNAVERTKQQNTPDPGSTIKGRENFKQEQRLPEVEAKEKAMDEQRLKEEKERAMRQREEAMQRGGQSADSRQRIEGAVQSIDRSSLDKGKVKDRHSEAQTQAKAAVDRLSQQCDDLQNRIIELKNEVREGKSTGVPDEELKENYTRIERLGALLNSAQQELYFLKYASSEKAPEAAPSGTPDKK